MGGTGRGRGMPGRLTPPWKVVVVLIVLITMNLSIALVEEARGAPGALW